MKRCKKLLSMILCILMVFGMFAGCNQQPSVETVGTTEPSETEEPEILYPTVVTEPSTEPAETRNDAATVEYTIVYVVNDGQLPENTQTVYSLATPVVLPVPTKEDCIFQGWFEEEDFSGDVVLTTAGQTGNKTYYAKWTAFESTEPTEAEEEDKKPGQSTGNSGAGSTGNSGQSDITHVHSYKIVESVKENCYDDGYNTYACKCGETYKQYIARAHKWGEWVIVREATDLEEGLKKRTCTECGVVEREKLTKLPHVHYYKATVIDPTCTDDGYTLYECNCGEVYTGAEFKATGHDYKAEVVAPTTEAEGYTLHQCANCGDSYKDTYTEKLPPEETEHVHSYTAVVTNPTCTVDGYTTYTCACGESYVDDSVAAAGHEYASQVIAPTTTAQGYTLHTCNLCGDSYTDSYVDKLPEETEPDDPYNPPDIPGHTHSWGGWIEHEDGWKYRTCAECGNIDIAW